MTITKLLAHLVSGQYVIALPKGLTLCKPCGLHFKAGRSDALYCSDACRKRAKRGEVRRIAG